MSTQPLTHGKPAETLKAFAAFCGQHQLHFVSNEIYASEFQELEGASSFVSVASLDLEANIDVAHVHVLHGASKDFCANGLRLGMVLSRNRGLITALSSIRSDESRRLDHAPKANSCSMLSWSPHLVQEIWAGMLENKEWRARFTSEKERLMQRRYVTTTDFLSKHGLFGSQCE